MPAYAAEPLPKVKAAPWRIDRPDTRRSEARLKTKMPAFSAPSIDGAEKAGSRQKSHEPGTFFKNASLPRFGEPLNFLTSPTEAHKI